MSNRVVIRNGKPGFIINGKFVPIPDSDNVNTTSPRIPRQQSGLDAVMSVIKNTVTGKGAAGIRQDATKPNPNYVEPGGRPKVNQNPDEYFGTGDYGSGGPKEKPKQKFPDLRGGDDKVDGYGNPKVDYTKTQPTSIKVEPYTPPTTTTSTPTPPKDEKKYKFSDKEGSYNLTKADINKKYDELRKNPARAKDFGLNANAAIFPNQKIFVDPKTGKRPSRFSDFTNSTTTKNPTNAATGGVNPRAGTYAAELKRTTDALSSNFGALPKGTIKPAAQRMKKEAYDLVLDYLLSEGHVDTVEEAHYVMLQMTSEHVQQVVEERTAADPKMKARMGHSNPAINGKPVRYPEGHPKAGEFMSLNKAETDGVNEYRKASKKAGRKIYADEPLPKN